MRTPWTSGRWVWDKTERFLLPLATDRRDFVNDSVGHVIMDFGVYEPRDGNRGVIALSGAMADTILSGNVSRIEAMRMSLERVCYLNGGES